MIYSLQLLRYFAAAIVVLTHTMGELGAALLVGDFGVDIVFVLSGLVIYVATERESKNLFSKTSYSDCSSILVFYYADGHCIVRPTSGR